MYIGASSEAKVEQLYLFSVYYAHCALVSQLTVCVVLGRWWQAAVWYYATCIENEKSSYIHIYLQYDGFKWNRTMRDEYTSSVCEGLPGEYFVDGILFLFMGLTAEQKKKSEDSKI